jgi:hypothetical protein
MSLTADQRRALWLLAGDQWDRQKSPRRRGGVAGGQRCVFGGVLSETTQRTHTGTLPKINEQGKGNIPICQPC